MYIYIYIIIYLHTYIYIYIHTYIYYTFRNHESPIHNYFSTILQQSSAPFVRLAEVDVLMCGQPLCVTLRPIFGDKVLAGNFLRSRLSIPIRPSGVALGPRVNKKAQDLKLS